MSASSWVTAKAMALEVSSSKVVTVMKYPCGCVVEKHVRAGKPSLYVIAGQDEGIIENPLGGAYHGGSLDRYMAKIIHTNCPHKKNKE